MRLAIAAGPSLAPYIAAKGSIALDGVSLTVNEVAAGADGGATFTVNIIPHTAAQTNFDAVRPSRGLNIEIDILARYIGRMLDSRATSV